MARTDRRDTLWQRGVVVIDDGEQGRHGSQIVIGRPPLQQLNNRAADAPDIRGRSGPRELNYLGGHPVRRTHNLSLLVGSSKRAGGDAKVGQLDSAIFRRQDVRALDIPVDDTLVVEILKALENLCHVDADEVLRELAVCLTDRMQRAVLAVPAQQSAARVSPAHPIYWSDVLEYDVQTVLRLDEANVFDDVVMVEVLEKVDLGLSWSTHVSNLRAQYSHQLDHLWACP